MPRPKGLPKTGGRPRTARLFTCAECGKQFIDAPSNRTHKAAYCSRRCAGIARERAAGHQPAIVAKCGLAGCETVVRRYVANSSKEFSGRVFCSRSHFMAWRHGKAER